jgi:hypothetical protein
LKTGFALCAGVFLVLFLRLQPPKKERSEHFRFTLRALSFSHTPANKVFARLFQKAAGCRGGALTKNDATELAEGE